MIIFISLSILLGLLSIFLHLKQNSGGKLGGSISPAKSFWLFYCIYSWLIFIPFICLTQDIAEPYRSTWMVFSIWFWIRSIVEMFMMFVTKNWTPPIGITHNISCLVILIGSPFFVSDGLAKFSDPQNIYHLSLILSLVMETIYAYSFWKIVGDKTKGDEAIWYASKENPAFKRVILTTAIANWPIYAGLVIITAHLAMR